MALKNFELKTLVRTFLTLFAVNGIKTLSYFLRRGVDNPATLGSADLWILTNLRRIWRKRAEVQYERKVSDDQMQASKLLVGFKEIVSESIRLKLRRQELEIPHGYI